MYASGTYTPLDPPSMQNLIDRLTELVPATVESHLDSPWSEIIEAADTITALSRRVKELENALRPFAEYADGSQCADLMGAACFAQVHLHRARFVLKEG